jgi:hypothetical protein
MNTPMSLRRCAHPRTHAPWSWRFLPWLPLVALVAWAVHLHWPHAIVDSDSVEPVATVSASSLVHWKDAQHDWLLVVDPSSHELVVYDANDGRPLHRLGTARGAKAIDSIVGEGNLLIATSQRDPRLQIFRLPGLQPALASR